MRLRTDDRAVTVQIGTVLLFAVLIVLLSTYQATVVPQQNEQVEFDHNQQVQGDLQDLRDELLRTGATGSGGSASMALGTQYPVRAFFVNPPNPSGTLRTTAVANVTVENATAVGEVGDYWDGTAHNFSTRGLIYEPNYHEYQRPPTTHYDNGVLYNRFEGADRTLAGQRLVRGNRISLVTVNGSVSESGGGRANLDVHAASAATRTVTVRNESSNVSVVVPTALPADEWAELLADQMGDGDARRVLAVEDGPRDGTVRIVLESGSYELQLAKVGVGSDASGVEPYYATDVRGDNESVAEDSSRKLVVEVRDRYNNPVSGARVNLSLVDSRVPDRLVHLDESGQTLTDLRTDARGRVAVRYEVDSFNGPNERVAVRTSIAETPSNDGDVPFADGATENLTFSLTAYNVGGGGGGDGGGPGDSPGSGETPAVNLRVDDLSHVNENRVDYMASYDVSNANDSFARVSVVYENVEEGARSTGVKNDTNTRGGLRYGLNSGAGQRWNVTARVVYENDAGEEYVAAQESIADDADALNPDGNADLGGSGSPAIQSYDVEDRTSSQQGPRYRIDYQIAGDFQRVEAAAIGLEGGGADGATATDRRGSIDLAPGYGRQTEFRVKFLVFDGDGAVVAIRADTDTAR